MRSFVAVTAVALLLTACSGGDDDATSKQPAQVAESAASGPGQQVGEPTAAQRTALLKGLAGIDPALSRGREQAFDNAVTTCADLLDPKDRTGRALRDAARLRFSGVAELDDAQTMKVLTVVRDTICPDAAWP
jgi:hypothetical protein